MITSRWFFALLLCTGCSITPLYDHINDDSCGRRAKISVIHGRDGQILRAELDRLVKSFPNSLSGYTIHIELERMQEPIAYDVYGSANMLVTQYVADVTVNDTDKHKLIVHDKFEVSDEIGISDSPGEIISSIYIDNDKSMLKKLAYNIFSRLDMVCKKLR